MPPAPEPQTPLSGVMQAPGSQAEGSAAPHASLAELPKPASLHVGLVPKLEASRAGIPAPEAPMQGTTASLELHGLRCIASAQIGTLAVSPQAHMVYGLFMGCSAYSPPRMRAVVIRLLRSVCSPQEQSGFLNWTNLCTAVAAHALRHLDMTLPPWHYVLQQLT